MNKLQALQNAAKPLGLEVRETNDSKPKYYLSMNGALKTIPHTYEEMNLILLGWRKAVQTLTQENLTA